MPLKPCVACVEVTVLVQMVCLPNRPDEAVLPAVIHPHPLLLRQVLGITHGAEQSLLRQAPQTKLEQVLTCALLPLDQTKASTGPISLDPVPKAPSPKVPGPHSPLPLASVPLLLVVDLPPSRLRQSILVTTEPGRCLICQRRLLSRGPVPRRSRITSKSAS